MAALRAQNQLTMLSYAGMQQTFQGHDEVDALRSQLALVQKGTVPDDVAAQAKLLDAALLKVGGGMPAGGGFRRAAAEPNALQSFYDLNNEYSTMVSMMQVGLDMAPTPTQIATWEFDCNSLNRTETAWQAAQKQVTDFNAGRSARTTCRRSSLRRKSPATRRALSSLFRNRADWSSLRRQESRSMLSFLDLTVTNPAAKNAALLLQQGGILASMG